jgi:hypothetical protein
MERYQSSSRHDSYGVNANCPDDTLASLPSTPAVRAWFFLVAVCVAVPRTPEVGGELLGAAGLFVAAAVVASFAVAVAPLVVVVALPCVVVVSFVVVTSCVVTA